MTFRIGTPHTHNAGYYYNGRSRGGKDEADVQTCKHCESIILMQQWKQDGGWCSKCQSPLCSNPQCVAQTAKYGCVPFIKKLETAMDMTVKLEQHLKIAGLDVPVAPQPIYTGDSRGSI